MKTNCYKLSLFVILMLLFGCVESQDKPKLNKLTKIDQFKIKVTEPSDLALSYEEDAFWTVSDDDSAIYKLSLDGKVIHKIKTKFGDLEGVTVLDKNKLAIAVEEEREISIIDLDGKVLKEVKLHLSGEYNKGLEGIVFNTDNNHFYAVNEKYPALLIELDKNFNVVNEKKIDFLLDLSAVTYDKVNKQLILLSDESKAIAVCDLKGNLIKKYQIDVQQAEGICLKGEFIYIVSDPRNEIYKFKF